MTFVWMGHLVTVQKYESDHFLKNMTLLNMARIFRTLSDELQSVCAFVYWIIFKNA